MAARATAPLRYYHGCGTLRGENMQTNACSNRTERIISRASKNIRRRASPLHVRRNTALSRTARATPHATRYRSTHQEGRI